MNTSANESSHKPLSLRWKRMSDEEKRRRIVDAILLLVGRHGVQWATTARIAATVGVSEPTLYRTFRNRKEMLLATVDRIWQQRRSELESFKATDSMDFLRKVCASHTVGVSKTRVVRFMTELAVSHAEGVSEYVRDLQFGDVQHLADVIDRGKAEGSIRSDVDTWETAWRIQAVYWLEAMARLHGLEEHVLTGFSSRRFESILADIEANRPAVPLAGEKPAPSPAASGGV